MGEIGTFAQMISCERVVLASFPPTWPPTAAAKCQLLASASSK